MLISKCHTCEFGIEPIVQLVTHIYDLPIVQLMTHIYDLRL